MSSKNHSAELIRQEIAKNHFQVTALIQDIQQCSGPLELLNELNAEGREKIATLKSSVDNLASLAETERDEKIKADLLSEIETYKEQHTAALAAFRKANVISACVIDKLARQDLLSISEEQQQALRKRRDKQGLANMSGQVTNQLLSISRHLAETMQRSADTLDTLMTSSDKVSGTKDELEHQQQVIVQSGKLLGKYEQEIGKKPKLNRKAISLEDKIKILDRLKHGEKISTVAKELELNESTVRTIKRNEHRIRTGASTGSSVCSVRIKNILILKMENYLMEWIQENATLNYNIIKEKALKIYANLKELKCVSSDESHNSEFSASKGWFEKFKKRFFLYRAKNEGKFMSTDLEILQEFPEDFPEIIEEEDYIEEQETSFNTDEINNTDEDSFEIFEEPKVFTLETINIGLELAKKLEMHFIENDPLIERSVQFKKKLHDCLAPYFKLKKEFESNSGQPLTNESFNNKTVEGDKLLNIKKKKESQTKRSSSDEETQVFKKRRRQN